MRLFGVIAAFVLVVFAGTALAEIYRYTDSKGELHFVDDITMVPKKYRKQLDNARPLADISIMDAVPITKRHKMDTAPAEPQARPVGSTNVEVYVTSSCGYCKKMLRFLNEKGIPYTSHDINRDSNAARTFAELGGRGVPVVRIGTHVVHGYNPDAVMSYLNGGK